MPVTTFTEARAKHLTDLDSAFASLRSLLADPKLLNPAYKPLVLETERLVRLTRIIIDLNNCEDDAQEPQE